MNTYDGKEAFRRTNTTLGRLDETSMGPVVFSSWSDAVFSAVIEIFGVTKPDLVGKSRRRVFAWARQVGAALSYQFGNCSFHSVGDVYGGRHYSWVYYSRQTVAKAMGRSELTTGQVQAVYNLARSRFIEE